MRSYSKVREKKKNKVTAVESWCSRDNKIPAANELKNYANCFLLK